MEMPPEGSRQVCIQQGHGHSMSTVACQHLVMNMGSRAAAEAATSCRGFSSMATMRATAILLCHALQDDPPACVHRAGAWTSQTGKHRFQVHVALRTGPTWSCPWSGE